jgi:hypothetical protein
LSNFHIMQLPGVSQRQRKKAELRRAGADDAQDLAGGGEMRQDLQPPRWKVFENAKLKNT